ncbi:uncharacterized protein E0L32_006225 [Thyridium curvatum]|uniref:Ribosomal RNA-processing protein 7 n=1 Tax=Thyridium curvatum TaxID=1093900 RepID=A0A507ATD4_9PEZI|nr:uncharacterized protein E0L32_006225 [Thyridium curvatum]TPX13252.1 hypothetical protein E0L32_006225 [Thyridium curvatum]
MAPIPKSIGDFVVLPLSIPALPSYPKAVIHHIYVRKNAPKNPTPDDERSLFVTNVPIDSTEAHLRALFVSLVGAGRFESIAFEDEKTGAAQTPAIQPGQAARLSALSKKRKRDEAEEEEAQEEEAARLLETWSRPLRRSGSTAVALMADEKSADLVLKAITKLHKTKKYPVWGEGVSDKVPAMGSAWLRSHNQMAYPDKVDVQSAVDAFFTVFNRREKEAAEMAKRLRNEPDEDGFVTVTRGGRNGPAGKAEAEEARQKMVAKQDKKKSELTNFYRFQLRERKKAEQAELLKKFDEDRKKVAAMREKRGKFRPEA